MVKSISTIILPIQEEFSKAELHTDTQVNHRHTARYCQSSGMSLMPTSVSEHSGRPFAQHLNVVHLYVNT